MTIPDSRGSIKVKKYTPGKKTNDGFIYYTRNCVFDLQKRIIEVLNIH